MPTTSLFGLPMGLILAITGAGGGILALPPLVFGTGISVAQAGPIALPAVAMAAGLGAVLALRAGPVRYRAAVPIAAAGMLLLPAGAWVARVADADWLGLIFALLLLYVAASTFRLAAGKGAAGQHQGTRACMRLPHTGRFAWTRPCALAPASSGSLAGFLSGLLGIGGGFVMLPALRRYTDLPPAQAVATSLTAIALLPATGAAAAALQGAMSWPTAAPFAAGTPAGMLAGSKLATRMAGPQQQRAFAALTVLVALGMIGKTLF